MFVYINHLSVWLSLLYDRKIFKHSNKTICHFFVLNSSICTQNGTHLSSLDESSSCKDLGIIFTNSLTWQAHYEMISSNAYKSLGLLRRVFKDSNCPEARKSLYITLVRSKLLYCSPLWRPYLLKDIESLEKVQRRATKFILSNYQSDYKTRLINTNWYVATNVHLRNCRHIILYQIHQKSIR